MPLKQNPPRSLRSASVDGVVSSLRSLVVNKVDNHEKYREEGDALFLYGHEGSGKSGLMASIHNALAEKGWLIHWLDCRDWPEDFDESNALVEDLKHVQALILDDLGMEPMAMRKYLGRIVAYRLKERLFTYITTNLDIDQNDRDACQLTEYYSAAERSRVFEGCDILCMEYSDRRL